MNKISISILSLGSILLPSAYAGPISSGGTQETAFQHDRAAIRTILDTDEVLGTLRNKGSVRSIAPGGNELDVYVITTERCELHVRFIRKCRQEEGGMPQCDYKSKVLRDASSRDCFE